MVLLSPRAELFAQPLTESPYHSREPGYPAECGQRNEALCPPRARCLERSPRPARTRFRRSSTKVPLPFDSVEEYKSTALLNV